MAKLSLIPRGQQEQNSQGFTILYGIYPRFKAIIYMDFDGTLLFNNGKFGNSFSITNNRAMLEEYRQIISHDHFLSTLTVEHDGPRDKYIKSPFASFKINNRHYVSEKTIIHDLGIENIKAPDAERIYIDGDRFYNVDVFEQSGHGSVTILDDERRIILRQHDR